MIPSETHTYTFMKTLMMRLATGPAHENAGGIFIGNREAIFISTVYVPCFWATGIIHENKTDTIRDRSDA
jgi:hypothetical protein